MIKYETFWELIDTFLEVINSETGFPVVIYDTRGYIINATDKSRIGDLHEGAEKIMKTLVPEYAVSAEEAARNPLVKEGYSCAISVDGEVVAGFGITGKLEQVTPFAKIATRMIKAWITEQESREKLVRSEHKYRNIFDNSAHGIFQTTLSGKIITANKAMADILGYRTPEDLIDLVSNVSTQIYVDPEDRETMLVALRETGFIEGFETRMKRKDGSVIDTRFSARILQDPETGLHYVEGFLQDITEELKANEALRLSEEKYFKTFNNCPVWVVLSSMETGRYVEVNETFLKTLGYKREEVLGHSSIEIATWIDSEERARVIKEIKEKGSVSGMEVSRKTKDGRVLDMLYWGEAIEVAGEMHLISVSLDITERNLAEKERAQLESLLAHSQKMDAIGQLAGGIAHDFNNMLGGIQGAAEMLALYLPDDAKARKFHKMILDAAGRSAELTRKLLAFSRGNPQASSAVDVHEVISETVVMLQSTLDRRIDLVVDLTAQKSTVVGDPAQLQNAILNLGINSSHAMPDGGKITITSRNRSIDRLYCNTSTFEIQPGDYLEIEVRDGGHGIKREFINKIFEPFFTTKPQGKGTGLGLAAVYGTVQQHRGAITVDSKPGGGAIFTILLPLAAGDEKRKKEPPTVVKGSGKILVVDDEEVMRLTAQAMLEDLGYEVIVAADGREALGIFQDQHETIDLVILDMVMPVMNGRDCFKALIHIDPRVRVILSSGFTREEDLEEMQEWGLKGFIRKPYRNFNLSQVIHKILQAES